MAAADVSPSTTGSHATVRYSCRRAEMGWLRSAARWRCERTRTAARAASEIAHTGPYVHGASAQHARKYERKPSW